MYFFWWGKNFGVLRYVDFLKGGVERGSLMKIF